MTRYVALLRGVNVGGKNVIAMADLRACFEAVGLQDVRTYIQSGNVLFSSRAAQADLTNRIETALAATFGYAASVVLRSRPQLSKIVEGAPRGFGERPKAYKYDVAFLKPPLTASTAMQSVAIKPGVDRAHAGPGALYFARLKSKASQSRLSRLASSPVYQRMTIRNWNTTTKLLEMSAEPRPRR
jgi:uncharacterized protein (DUF1697 family)